MDIIEEIKKLPKKRIRTFDSHFHWIIDFDKLDAPMSPPHPVVQEEIPEEPPKIPEPEPEPEPEKIVCDICGKEFSPQGFPKHYESCKRKKELQDKKAALEAELQTIGE